MKRLDNPDERTALGEPRNALIQRSYVSLLWALMLVLGLQFAPSSFAATKVVPSSLLRPWDAVTFFFDAAVGPSEPGPLKTPGELFEQWPRHPGAFQWIDAQTLQFRPAEPWPALARVRFKGRGLDAELRTMLDSPIATQPAAGAREVAGLRQFVLDFATPFEDAALRTQLSVVVRDAHASLAPPASGIAKTRARFAESLIQAPELDLKIVPGPSAAAPVRAIVVLPDAVAGGREVELRLALGRGPGAPVWRAHYTTREQFRPISFGCAKERFPVAKGGSIYTSATPLTCSGEGRHVAVGFSAPLGALDLDEARKLVRVTPSPGALQFRVKDRVLFVDADFDANATYRVELAAGALVDRDDRILRALPASAVHVRFPAKAAFLRWAKSAGTVERFGAKHVPLSGRSDTQLDLRIHKIEATDRGLWPFPKQPIVVDDLERPLGPGEAPTEFREPNRNATAAELAVRIKSLGSPEYSAIIASPLRGGAGANFGLDLDAPLAEFGLVKAPGTYLLGLRRASGNSQRAWMRVQVTDLALSTIETSDQVRFLVTSLRTGEPVSNASIAVEGWRDGLGWTTLLGGTTNVLGQWRWSAHDGLAGGRILRIVVTAGSDTLVLDPANAPERYQDQRWSEDFDTWLQWTRSPAKDLVERPGRHCHIFSERPVYRPDEPVHLKGWLRERVNGLFSIVSGAGTLLVRGPGEREWRYPLELTDSGSFYHQFAEEKLPTGEYWAEFEFPNWGSCGGFQFQKEDYKLPELEVSIHGPDRVSLDVPFAVSMSARYYAGGRVAKRPLQWRVTQFPYTWKPRVLTGFKFNSRGQFSGQTSLQSESVTEQSMTTDATGAAELKVNPALEASANARRYVIEASVTGNDGRVVTATRQVLGLPAFALGLKVPAVVRDGASVDTHIAVVGPQGKLLADQVVVARLLRREWHAHLRAGDRSSGVAKYVTEHVDKMVSERSLISAAEPLLARFDVPRAGVYLLELEARDRLGRVQTLRTDFYVSGGEALTWSRPPARVFNVATDATEYAPGDVAQVIVQSPYQRAHALMVVEAPQGNRYSWIDINNGAATVDVPVSAEHVPRLPVHFLLIRGRTGSSVPRAGLDLGKPTTLASTVSLAVSTRTNQVEVKVEHPPRARPGERVTLDVKLADEHGKPLAGEVTLWLVDQAVLALGKERRLDPLRDFVQARQSRVRMHDTRNSLFGFLPYVEYPGGGSGDSEPGDLLDNVTPRKRFVPVAYYAPSIAVGSSGVASVEIELPDNLTVFKVRAKAISGAARFGFATGQLAVRVPLVVQPTLPRFVRPGDSFSAGAVARVVDGPEGSARLALRVDGLSLTTPDTQSIELSRAGARYGFDVTVPANASGEVGVTVALERNADKATDAFAVTLPVRPDQRARTERRTVELPAGVSIEFPALAMPARGATLKRRVVMSAQLALLHMTGAATYLKEYPYGCTEQRISQAQAALALRRFSDKAGLVQADAQGNAVGDAQLAVELAETFNWISTAFDSRELVAFWPGSGGFVSLTAWSLQLAVAARAAGQDVPAGLETRLVRSLRRALRSDFPGFVSDAAFVERAWALAALADAGLADAAYAAELARRAAFLPLESVAQVLRTLARTSQGAQPAVEALETAMWAGIQQRMQDGKARYLGLSEQAGSSALILPSETRTISEVMRTALVLKTEQARTDLLLDALLGLGASNGWGDTNANAAAMMALADVFAGADQSCQTGAPAVTEVLMTSAASESRWPIDRALIRQDVHDAGAFTLRANAPLVARVESRYVPLASGALTPAHTQGFVVNRDWLRVPSVAGPLERVELAVPGAQVEVAIGAIVEERIEVVNPQLRFHVVVVAPLGAGFELLNPALANAPAQASVSRPDSLSPSYQDRRDDEVRWYFNELPAGRHVLRYRVRAVTPGSFVQPGAYAEAMYDAAIVGNSRGARVVVTAVKSTP